MPIFADYYYQSDRRSDNKSTIVYLHGSGRSETDGADFLARLSMRCDGILVRGPYSQRPGYGFVRRNEDHSLNYNELQADAIEFAAFLKELENTLSQPTKPPILIGYSSGAIMAAATLWTYPTLISGAVLLRPQSPSMERPVPLNGLPILLLSGLWDERRAPEAATSLEIELKQSGAKVTHLTVKAGHKEAIDGSDFAFTSRWLEDHFFAN